MRIDGEAKDKLYSIMADAIDLGRLYESAIMLLKAEKDQSAELMDEADELRNENARLQERCDVLERSFGDTAALEHTVNELQERNDQLRMRVDVINSKPGGNWKAMYDIARQTLGDVESDTNWLFVLDSRLGQLVEMHEADQDRPVLDGDDAWWWRDTANEARRILAETKAELERYKAFVRGFATALRDRPYCGPETIRREIIATMKEEGYDIEKEPIEGFGSSGCEDNSKSKDEHDFL